MIPYNLKFFYFLFLNLSIAYRLSALKLHAFYLLKTPNIYAVNYRAPRYHNLLITGNFEFVQNVLIIKDMGFVQVS